MTNKTFLDKAYGLETVDETRALYDAWSKSYDDEVSQNGYATPGRVAEALARALPDRSVPVLDYGCGTGLSGLALKSAGFSNIHGADPSPEMLAKSQAKSFYNTTTLLDLDAALPFAPGQFKVIAAIGVLGAGAAPVEVFDLLTDLLTPGDYFALSYNDHTLEDAQFTDKLDSFKSSGRAVLISEEYGAHLPGKDLKSMVYVLQSQ